MYKVRAIPGFKYVRRSFKFVMIRTKEEPVELEGYEEPLYQVVRKGKKLEVIIDAPYSDYREMRVYEYPDYLIIDLPVMKEFLGTKLWNDRYLLKVPLEGAGEIIDIKVSKVKWYIKVGDNN